MVLLHLSRQLLQNFSCKLNSIIIMLRKLNELHEVALRLIPLKIRHLAIIIIQFMHGTPVIPISYSNYDDTQRQLTTFDQQVLHFLLVVNDTISQDQKDHILLHVLFHTLTDAHRLSQQRGEESRP
jgi:hypothetical protein